jgi:chaperonin cofactor prefoldin
MRVDRENVWFYGIFGFLAASIIIAAVGVAFFAGPSKRERIERLEQRMEEVEQRVKYLEDNS